MGHRASALAEDLQLRVIDVNAVRDHGPRRRDADLREVADRRHPRHALHRGALLCALVRVRVHERLAQLGEHADRLE